MFRLTRARVLLALGALVVMLAYTINEADAARRGGSIGSRGTKTYTAPPPTATAPNTAAPINRSMTQPGQAAPSAAQRPGAAPQPGGLFSGRGLLGGLAAGFLGAGLIGLLMGNGFFAGMAGFAAFLGLLIQVALIGFLALLAWRWWQRRSQPATATGPDLRDARHGEARATGPVLRDMPAEPAPAASGAMGLGGLRLGGLASPQPGPAEPSDEIGITPQDYDDFERLLGDIQVAYGKGDIDALGERVTPEILSYFAEEIAERDKQGLASEVKDVKLLQGDLAEAWREGSTDYATVAMRFSMLDRTVERASGRVVDGGHEQPVEITEVWTFMRPRGEGWALSAIQEV